MIISDDRLQKALTYLAETDEPTATARAYVDALDEQKKTVLALAFMSSNAPTVKEREQAALCSPEYREHLEKLQNARADYELYRNKRITESAIVEVWRSLNSNRRQGVT